MYILVLVSRVSSREVNCFNNNVSEEIKKRIQNANKCCYGLKKQFTNLN
jgi:hypothetical protein